MDKNYINCKYNIVNIEMFIKKLVNLFSKFSIFVRFSEIKNFSFICEHFFKLYFILYKFNLKQHWHRSTPVLNLWNWSVAILLIYSHGKIKIFTDKLKEKIVLCTNIDHIYIFKCIWIYVCLWTNYNKINQC